MCFSCVQIHVELTLLLEQKLRNRHTVLGLSQQPWALFKPAKFGARLMRTNT